LRHQRLVDHVEPFVAAGLLDAADVLIIDAAVRRFNASDPDVLLAAALALSVQRRGHVGVDLLAVGELAGNLEPLDERAGGVASPPVWPADLASWQRKVLASSLVSLDGDRKRPFVAQVLPEGRHLLMTQRLWDVQQRLANRLLQLAGAIAAHAPDQDRLHEALSRSLLAGAKPEHREAKEQVARDLAVAARSRLTLVLGGPGTGKTFSIRHLLAALLADRPQLRVVLAAPTGKAAVRMTEAMHEAGRGALANDKCSELLAQLPSSTVHKLLGKRPDGSVRHNRDNPLPADIVVVDEASMVDLVLMGEVVEAVAPGAQLVLLGDRDQLASVDVGTVLADIAQAAADPASPLHPCLVRLTVNYRFADAPLVSAVAAAIQGGSVAGLGAATDLLNGRPATTDAPRDVAAILPIPVETFAHRSEAMRRLAQPYCEMGGYVAVLAGHLRTGGRAALCDTRVRRELLDAIGGYRVLAVHRKGPLGVSGLEKAIGQHVRDVLTAAWQDRKRSHSSRPPARADELPREGGLWLGQLVLVTENAYDVDLRNGDIGVVVCGEGNRLAVVFPVAAPGDDAAGSPATQWPGAREVSIARLPPHMGALAMTVHKSQGSQFRHVGLVLADGPSTLQSRELVYTAITRAQRQLTWVGSERALSTALQRTVTRASGLATLLGARVGGPAAGQEGQSGP